MTSPKYNFARILAPNIFSLKALNRLTPQNILDIPGFSENQLQSLSPLGTRLLINSLYRMAHLADGDSLFTMICIRSDVIFVQAFYNKFLPVVDADLIRCVFSHCGSKYHPDFETIRWLIRTFSHVFDQIYQLCDGEVEDEDVVDLVFSGDLDVDRCLILCFEAVCLRQDDFDLAEAILEQISDYTAERKHSTFHYICSQTTGVCDAAMWLSERWNNIVLGRCGFILENAFLHGTCAYVVMVLDRMGFHLGECDFAKCVVGKRELGYYAPGHWLFLAWINDNDSDNNLLEELINYASDFYSVRNKHDIMRDAERLGPIDKIDFVQKLADFNFDIETNTSTETF